jgi:hypothetical protein
MAAFPDSLVPQIMDLYAANAVQPMPTEAHLRQLIGMAFYASLERDEGRPIRCSIVLVEEEHMQLPPSAIWQPLPFQARRPATVGEIAKLASATDVHQTLIALTESDGVLEIAGLVRTGRERFRMRRNAAFSCTVMHLPLAHLAIEGPGSLAIGCYTKRLLSFSGGRLLQAPTPVLRDAGPVHAQLGVVATAMSGPDIGVEATRLGLCLAAILRGIVDRGHGGALVIASSNEARVHSRPKYRVDSTELKRDILEYWDYWEARARAESDAHRSNGDDRGQTRADDATRATLYAKRSLANGTCHTASIGSTTLSTPARILLESTAPFFWVRTSRC